jgi:hypothetical protein
MIKEAELFYEFPYPLSPQQITSLFVWQLLIGWVCVWLFTTGVGRYFSHECSPVL